ncbi:hypothetical protein MTQ13_00530 [Streptomyces sp. XM4011]|uniref:hypothetical protein n=1 Tax=Streptomyces sp. XM4011 TaxID=2929780 RepID=UPI001FF9FE28|nr:hypothetical protein [Streptomyces sp. XM4011]MCK1812777.1 hypothetical protein [Streptomyces sp. XM4011]
MGPTCRTQPRPRPHAPTRTRRNGPSAAAINDAIRSLVQRVAHANHEWHDEDRAELLRLYEAWHIALTCPTRAT